jgi:hypothetical protein
MQPHLNGLMDMCLQYVTYDPNYNYDDDEDEVDMEDGTWFSQVSKRKMDYHVLLPRFIDFSPFRNRRF